MQKGKVIVFYGPSAGGKTSVQKSLKSLYNAITTATTRSPREGEIDGTHYYFYELEKFIEADLNGEFLEKNNYLGNWYGVPYKSIEDTIQSGETRTLIVDLNGARSVKEKFEDNALIIYIGADKESLKRRFLEERKSEQQEVEDRLLKAEEELSEEYLKYADFVIWNNDGVEFENTLQNIKKIIGNF